jgi:hypothetical protein
MSTAKNARHLPHERTEAGLQSYRASGTQSSHLNVGNFTANNEGDPYTHTPLVRKAASIYIEV